MGLPCLLLADNPAAPSLSADEPLIYDDSTQIVRAQKNAVLRSDDFLLHADEILWDRNKSLVKATGKTIISVRGVRILCDSLQLNLQNGDYEAQGVKAGFSSLTVEADFIHRKGSDIKASNSLLSNPNYFEGEYHPAMTFKEFTFDENKSLSKTSTGWLKFGKLPISPIPSLTFKSGGKNKSIRLGLKGGKRSNLGWYLGNEIQWQAGEIKAGTEMTGYTKRGVLLSSNFSYDLTDDDGNSPWIQSFIDFGWIKDQGRELGLDRRDLPFSEQRNSVNAEFVIHNRRTLRLAGQLNYESDSEITRDFHIEKFNQSQWNDHFIEFAYEEDWGGVSSLQRWQINEHEGILERRPNLRLEVSPRPLILDSLYHTLSVEYVDLQERDPLGQVLNKSTKLDMSLQSFHPFKIGKGFTYTPALTIRNQLYQLRAHSPNHTWIEKSHELRFHTFADYSITSDLWEINDLRHSMNFILTYSDLDLSSSNGARRITPIDASVFSLNLEPLNLMDVIEADQLDDMEVIRLDWHHQVVTNFDSNLRELLSLKISQDLWKETPSLASQDKSFFAQVDLHPARWLQIRGQAKHNKDDSKKLSVFSAIIKDGFQNYYQISRVEYPIASNQWAVTASKLIDSSKMLMLSVRYDSEDHEFLYWETAFEFKTKHSIVYRIFLSERFGTAKEDEFAVNFGVRLLSF